ncbi:MAG: response regulator [Cyanobacteria bacterium P01_G01_bin.38]
MAHDKELEIKLQFLDEAEEYLNTLDQALLGVAQNGIDLAKMNNALRAAHSIKGGAALMGYATLSDLSHRIEDSLKVLRLQRDDIVISGALEGQLLTAVDTLKQIVVRDRNQQPPDDAWLMTAVLPVFEQLYDELGEPSAEDASTLLATDDGQDILPMLFQTEVEGCLDRLEEAIQTNTANLREEVEILSQELGGLGEMLELKAFSQLCRSTEGAVKAAADGPQIKEVAEAALQAWRQSQALVLTNNVAEIPNQLSDLSFEIPDVGDVADPSWDDTPDWEAPLTEDWEPTSPQPEDIFAPKAQNIEAPNTQAPNTEVFATETYNAEAHNAEAYNEAHSTEAQNNGAFTNTAASNNTPNNNGASSAQAASAGTEFRFSEAPTTDPADTDQDATVRVSVRQLNELNDFFGELTIERNRLESEVKRLRTLAGALNKRLRSLNEFNSDLRDAYDQAATKPERSSFLLPGTASESAAAGPSFLAQYSSNGFDALELDQYDERHLPVREQMETVVRLQEVADDIELSVDNAEQSTRNLQRTARQLQRNLNKLRMRPLSDVTNRFPRALRELCLEYGKQVELKLEGDNTLIDRNILESLNDPLMHILRNAFDHGIEAPDVRREKGKPQQGLISIKATQRSNRTLITIKDDGSGIALDKIKERAMEMGLDENLLATASKADLLSLIFEPGFTTASNVTALSGRGVGMDVVRNNLKQIRGDISVSTQAGEGTTFNISVPYTLSISRVLLAESNRMPLALPTDNIEEITVVAPAERYLQNGHEIFTWRGQPIRLINLSKWLAFNCPRQIDSLENTPNVSVPSVLVVSYNEQYIGLQIDRSWGEQEVAVRRVEGNVGLPSGFNNCTILGDGKVVPLVNTSELLRWIISCEGSNIQSAQLLYANPLLSGSFAGLSLQPTGGQIETPTVMIIDDSINVRRLLALTLEKQGYQVAQAKDGIDAMEKLEAGLAVNAIICDVEMPRLDGYGFLSRLRAKEAYANIPVTMLTSRSGEKHRQLAMTLGAHAYFSKPYREQALLKTLENSIRPAMAN